MNIHTPERNAGESHVGKVIIDGEPCSLDTVERLIKDLTTAVAFAKAAGTTREQRNGRAGLPTGLTLSRDPHSGWQGTFGITVAHLASDVIADAPVEVSVVAYDTDELKTVSLIRGLLVACDRDYLTFEDDFKVQIDLIDTFCVDS